MYTYVCVCFALRFVQHLETSVNSYGFLKHRLVYEIMKSQVNTNSICKLIHSDINAICR